MVLPRRDIYFFKTDYYGLDEFKITGEIKSLSSAKICYTLHPIHLEQHDRQELQMKPEHLPSPIINTRMSGSFSLSPEASIMYE